MGNYADALKVNALMTELGVRLGDLESLLLTQHVEDELTNPTALEEAYSIVQSKVDPGSHPVEDSLWEALMDETRDCLHEAGLLSEEY